MDPPFFSFIKGFCQNGNPGVRFILIYNIPNIHALIFIANIRFGAVKIDQGSKNGAIRMLKKEFKLYLFNPKQNYQDIFQQLNE